MTVWMKKSRPKKHHTSHHITMAASSPSVSRLRGDSGAAVNSSSSSSSLSSTPRSSTLLHQVKLIIIGNPSVGKTTTCVSFTDHQGRHVPEDTPSTVGIETKAKKISLIDPTTEDVVMDDKLKVTVWDTAGQEQYKSMMPSYYRQSHIVLFVLDVLDRSSLDDLIVNWIPAVKTNAMISPVYVVAANKVDKFYEPATAHKGRAPVGKKRVSKKEKKEKKSSSSSISERQGSASEGVPPLPSSSSSLALGASASNTTLASVSSTTSLGASSSSAPVLTRMTRQQIYNSLKDHLPNFSIDDVIDLSAKEGYNVNALFIHALLKYVKYGTTLHVSQTVRNKMEQALQYMCTEYYVDNFTTWRHATAREAQYDPNSSSEMNSLWAPAPEIHADGSAAAATTTTQSNGRPSPITPRGGHRVTFSDPNTTDGVYDTMATQYGTIQTVRNANSSHPPAGILLTAQPCNTAAPQAGCNC